MGYRFPHSRNILLTVLDNFGTTYQRINPGFTDDLVAPDEETPDVIPAAIHVYKVGGRRSRVERTEKFRVDVYAFGTDPAFDVAEVIVEFLEDRHHAVEGRDEWGLIDDVTVDSEPVEVPYPSDTISQVSTTFGVQTRAM